MLKLLLCYIYTVLCCALLSTAAGAASCWLIKLHCKTAVLNLHGMPYVLLNVM